MKNENKHRKRHREQQKKNQICTSGKNETTMFNTHYNNTSRRRWSQSRHNAKCPCRVSAEPAKQFRNFGESSANRRDLFLETYFKLFPPRTYKEIVKDLHNFQDQDHDYYLRVIIFFTHDSCGYYFSLTQQTAISWERASICGNLMIRTSFCRFTVSGVRTSALTRTSIEFSEEG